MSKRQEDFNEMSKDLHVQFLSNPWTLFEKGCEYGYQYALQHPHWIPVEEKLPYERKVVWVRKHFNKEVLGEFDIYDSAAFCNGEFQCDNSGNVTHWMEIVPPIKED